VGEDGFGRERRWDSEQVDRGQLPELPVKQALQFDETTPMAEEIVF